ncbi:retrovirus-related pol polyprotein from transposon TNT 1-94 [Tanacetum coccineum]
MYKLLHDRKPDLSFVHVFGALCYPTNDGEELSKLKPKGDIGIFVSYAPAKKVFRIYNKRTRMIIKTTHVDFDELAAMDFEQFSSGPGPKLMTPGTIIPTVIAPEPTVSTGTPSSTTIDQDAPSTSTSQTNQETPSLVISLSVEEADHDIKVAYMDNNPYSPRGIFLNQSKYALESLKKYGMETCNPVDTPMVEKSKLDEDPQGKAVDPTRYRGMIGTLRYLTSSRPDLVFSMCMSFADADHTGCQDTRKSTSGSMQLLGDRLVSRSSKKQKSTAKSSTKGEYISLSGCCA